MSLVYTRSVVLVVICSVDTETAVCNGLAAEGFPTAFTVNVEPPLEEELITLLQKKYAG